MAALSVNVTAVDSTRRPIRRALISVFDKTGLIELATALTEAGVTLVSTGSTAMKIAEAGIAVTPVEQVTGFPECLDGRVKTLHPNIHAGILADPAKREHDNQLASLGVEPFDLVVVNLYPFVQTVASGSEPDDVVEQIDIGGPAMVRAAAKNHARVAVIVDPARYGEVAQAVQSGGFSLTARRRLAGEAYAHTAAYDVAVASWFQSVYAKLDDEQFPRFLGATWDRAEILRYGENPHQSAALFTSATPDGSTFGLAGATQLHGKAMSYNNYVDADAAWRAAYDHDAPAVAIIKHANPCGIAVGQTVAVAHARAHACDPLSAFGGVIAANGPLTVAAAEQIAPIFTEVVLAPEFEPGAVEILAEKKNIRVLQVPRPAQAMSEMRLISGGMLIQQVDRIDAPGDDPTTWELVAGEEVDERTMADLVFAWRSVRAVKSNAILLARDGASVGIGMGQVNRVDSCRLAVERAVVDSVDRAKGSVAASDAFFPFPDGLQVLIDAGVRAVVHPGGSIRDKQVTAAAQEAGISMFLTGTRHFMH